MTQIRAYRTGANRRKTELAQTGAERNWSKTMITEELIHTHPTRQFKLYRRPHRSNDNWTSLKLIRPLGKKRNWWLGWNGKRIAKSHDAKLLFEHEPEIYQWVIQTALESPSQ